MRIFRKIVNENCTFFFQRENVLVSRKNASSPIDNWANYPLPNLQQLCHAPINTSKKAYFCERKRERKNKGKRPERR